MASAAICSLAFLLVTFLLMPCSNALAKEQNVRGQAIMHKVASTLSNVSTIQSKLRLKTDLLGHPLVGSGIYAQLKSSDELLLRMELGIQVGERTSSIKQISDGRMLWEHWRMGDTERVNRVDLKKVAQTLAATAEPPASIAMTSSNLANGGLPRLAAQLNKNFDFDMRAVQSGRIPRIGEAKPHQRNAEPTIDVWAVTGVWKTDALAMTAPKAVADGEVSWEKLPPHLPHEVQLVIGKRDFFPYRITYQRWVQKDGKPNLIPIVRTEFFHVVIDEVVDQAQFQYAQPTDMNVADNTDSFLESLGVASKPASVSSR